MGEGGWDLGSVAVEFTEWHVKNCWPPHYGYVQNTIDPLLFAWAFEYSNVLLYKYNREPLNTVYIEIIRLDPLDINHHFCMLPE